MIRSIIEHFKIRVMRNNEGKLDATQIGAIAGGGIGAYTGGPAGAVKGASLGASAGGFFDSLFGKKKKSQTVNLPSFYEDPEFQKTQSFLSDYGINILSGDIPDYYKAIGETGSQQFEDVLNLQNRDISRSIQDAAAATGRGRGGGVSEQVGRAVAENTTKARFADYLRALTGKQFFFQEGRGITEGVRGAGLNNQQQRNNFNLDILNAQLGLQRRDDNILMNTAQVQGQTASGAIQNIADIIPEIFTKKQTSGTINTVKKPITKVTGTYGKIDSKEDIRNFIDTLLP